MTAWLLELAGRAQYGTKLGAYQEAWIAYFNRSGREEAVWRKTGLQGSGSYSLSEIKFPIIMTTNQIKTKAY